MTAGANAHNGRQHGGLSRCWLLMKRAAHLSHSQGAYFDGSLELLRELAVTIDVDAALPRLSAIVSKMLPHDALRMVCLDQQGRPIVNASTADVPDMMAADADEVIIGDLRSGARGRNRRPARDGAAGRRRLPLGPGSVDARTGAFGPRGLLVEEAAGVQSRARAARPSYRLPPRARDTDRARSEQRSPQIDDDRVERGDARVQRAVEQATGGHPRCVSSASPPNGAACCARRRRSPRRTRPCW